MAEHAFPLAEIPPIQSLHMKGPPPFQWSMVFGDGRAARYDYRQRAFPFQLWLLYLLAPEETKEQNRDDRN